MRLKNFLGFAVAIASFGIVAAPQSASAADFGRSERHARYRNVVVEDTYVDPYAYSYSPRGYYPYYNSNYWGPPRIRRIRYQLPPYYAAWGAPRRGYNHYEWHMRHYGRHRRGHW